MEGESGNGCYRHSGRGRECGFVIADCDGWRKTIRPRQIGSGRFFDFIPSVDDPAN